MKMQEPTENLFLKELMPILQIWKIDWHTDKVTVYQRTLYHLKILLLPTSTASSVAPPGRVQLARVRKRRAWRDAERWACWRKQLARRPGVEWHRNQSPTRRTRWMKSRSNAGSWSIGAGVRACCSAWNARAASSFQRNPSFLRRAVSGAAMLPKLQMNRR